MKKMIFTAMAVLAFSAVSMANTIEVKEEVVVNNESKVKKTVVQIKDDADCYEKAANYIDNVYDRNHNHTQEQNHDAFQAYLDGCLGN